MRLSRDKLNKLAHVVTDALADLDAVDFIEDRNTVRLEARKVLEELMAQEARIDSAARQKIESQRRTILEGSQEWDILYRKYYNEEVKKLVDAEAADLRGEPAFQPGEIIEGMHEKIPDGHHSNKRAARSVLD